MRLMQKLNRMMDRDVASDEEEDEQMRIDS